MELVKIIRKFVLVKENQNIELQDVNPLLPVTDIVELYSNHYPELLNAKIENKGIVDDVLTFEFQTIAGTKG